MIVHGEFSYQVIVSGLAFDEAAKTSILYENDMIFGYEDISEYNHSFESILNNWFALFDRANNNNDNIVYLYTANKYIKGYQEPIFLNIVQALELYYDNILNKQLSSTSEASVSEDDLKAIEDILSASLEQISDNAKQWIEDKIDYARRNPNSSTAIQKWKQMFNHAIPLSTDFSCNIDRLCKKIKDTRNYYTHYGKNLRDKAAKGEDLYWLTSSVSYLLLYFLLIEIGFKPEDIQNILSRNNEYNFFKDKIKQLIV
jgi:ApeA N-terminal domain 1